MLLAPLLRSFNQRWSVARRTVVTRASLGKLLVELGVAEACADGDAVSCAAWFSAGAAPPQPAWAACDLLISAVSDGRDTWAGHARRLSRARQILFFQPRPPPGFRDHVTVFHRRQLAELDLPEPALPPPRHNSAGAVLIHPGSGGVAKCWPLPRFIAVGRALVQAGRTVEFVLGEAERERLAPAAIAALEQAFTVHTALSLPQLVLLFRQAAGYIGNDSGPTHLAAALGLPTVAVFTVSEPRVWRPIGPQVQVVRGDGSLREHTMETHKPIQPLRLKLKKSEHLEIDWSDGCRSIHSLRLLRRLCPCANCQGERDLLGRQLLPVVRTAYDGPITALGAELVGNYAVRILWSDQHATGIYSFDYLRQLPSEAIASAGNDRQR